MADSLQWFYVDTEDGESRGPVPTCQIKKLPLDTYIWNEKICTQWTQIKNIQLFQNQPNTNTETSIDQEYDCQYMSMSEHIHIQPTDIMPPISLQNDTTQPTEMVLNPINDNENKINDKNIPLNLMTLAALSQFSDDNSEEIIDEELTIPDSNLILNTPIENMKIFNEKCVGNMAMAMAPVMDVINTNELNIDINKKLYTNISGLGIESPNMPLQNLENNSLPNVFDNNDSNFIIHKIPKNMNGNHKQIIAQPPSVNSFKNENNNLKKDHKIVNFIECPLCTFHNDINAMKCNMCQTKFDRKYNGNDEGIKQNINMKNEPEIRIENDCKLQNENVNIKVKNESINDEKIMNKIMKNVNVNINDNGKDEYKIDDYIRLIDLRHGYIRFIGQTEFSKQILYGIELDNKYNGKHNGIYNGIKYFHCALPNKGVFVTVNKIDTVINKNGINNVKRNENMNGNINNVKNINIENNDLNNLPNVLIECNINDMIIISLFIAKQINLKALNPFNISKIEPLFMDEKLNGNIISKINQKEFVNKAKKYDIPAPKASKLLINIKKYFKDKNSKNKNEKIKRIRMENNNENKKVKNNKQFIHTSIQTQEYKYIFNNNIINQNQSENKIKVNKNQQISNMKSVNENKNNLNEKLDIEMEELMNNLEIPDTARITMRKLPNDKKLQMIEQYKNNKKLNDKKNNNSKKNSLFKKNKKRDSKLNKNLNKKRDSEINKNVNIDDMIDNRLKNDKNIHKKSQKQIEKSNINEIKPRQENILSVFDGYINKYNKSPQNATQLMKFSKLNNEFKPLNFKQAKNIFNSQKNKNNKSEKKKKISKFWGKKKVKTTNENTAKKIDNNAIDKNAKKLDKKTATFLPPKPKAKSMTITVNKPMQKQVQNAVKKINNKRVKSIWDINENAGDDPNSSTYMKNKIINNYNMSRIIEQSAQSVMKDKMGIISPQTIQMKSVFDESSSDEEDDDNNNNQRLTVNLKKAKHNVSSHVNVKL